MLITPVGFDGEVILIPSSIMIWNCFIADVPSGTFGTGKSRDILLATQRLPFESKATPRPAMPARKVSALDGSLAGNRTTMSDWELLTQTRFCASMAMPKGDRR